jgi:PTH2 family peptidyl-tRNA hydrolase
MKQVIVMRSDLKMGKGKIAAQAAHASLLAVEQCMQVQPTWYAEWGSGLYKKIVLKIDTETALLGVLDAAVRHGIPAVVVSDAGLTQVAPSTKTCVGIGPAPDDEIDAITAGLKLL